MDFYLTRPKQSELRDKLGTVPALAEDLAVTVTRQARIQKSGLGKPRRQKPESRVPYHIGASDAADALHNCLVTWVRFICEERQVYYRGHDDDISLSRWLRSHVTVLALIPGSEESCDEIVGCIDECRRQVDLPPEDLVVIDAARVRAANRQVVTAGQVEKIAGKLGLLGKGLNKRRVETLVRQRELSPCARDGDVRFYRLGDVLDAHHRKRDGA
ncbi:hypothetical protein [Mycolicibacterium brisbanense]|uniref:Uncharacterized protein n=1 Tax=Mycolicibacterium brisbanense TaxID=146020 RepID=A0A100W6R5_9MYCO|nr:hypothetical protein [Mycolicibacterium brisbanense]MCV7158020.1 hypothetical protein [Mycolicibacterium brisbanense]GAS92669.1 uncharacterized protein RMCB_6765 [Mycolicibacterium brisbanense]